MQTFSRRGFQLRSASLETRVAYTFFLVLCVLGIATLFALAFDERQPTLMSCATNGGEVYNSQDGGETWTTLPTPPGGTQIYALARG